MALIQPPMAGVPTPKPQGNDAPLAAAEGDAPMPGDEESNVGPEEQAQYETFVKKAAEVIYQGGDEDAKVNPAVVESLTVKDGEGAKVSNMDPATGSGNRPEGGNPYIMALANTALMIVTKIDDAAREAGQPLSDDVLEHGAVEIIEMLGEVAEAAGIHDYSPEDLTGAFVQAVDMFRPHAIDTGRTSDETLKGQFAEIDEADRAGKLGDVLPGAEGATLGSPPIQPA